MSISDIFRKMFNPSKVRQESLPADVDAGSWELETAIPLRRLCALYMEHGWNLSIDGKVGVPLPQGLADFIADNVATVYDDEPTTYLAAGRMLFIKTEDFPDCVDVYLHVATAYQDDLTEVTVD